jgi:hypothetical protein
MPAWNRRVPSSKWGSEDDQSRNSCIECKGENDGDWSGLEFEFHTDQPRQIWDVKIISDCPFARSRHLDVFHIWPWIWRSVTAGVGPWKNSSKSHINVLRPVTWSRDRAYNPRSDSASNLVEMGSNCSYGIAWHLEVRIAGLWDRTL